MMSYSSPELVDAELRYRHERLARDWQIRQARNGASAYPGHWARTVVAAITGLGLVGRRHRHA